MGEYVVRLKEFQSRDPALVGNKAATLSVLLDAGFPVPDGVCVTTRAFRQALEPYLEKIDAILQKVDCNNPGELLYTSTHIKTLLANLAIPTRVIAGVKQILASIAATGTPLAVRSSATAEDSPGASYAGYYKSVIGVRGEDALCAAILDVWRSTFNPEALPFLLKQNEKEKENAMGVLILPVVEAECSGVAFSVDPVGNRNNRVVISAAWGLGVGVVDGSVGTDTAWVCREGATEGFEIEDYRVVEKGNQIILDPKDGLVQRTLTADRRYSACLPDPWLIRVAQFCVAAEVLFGYPQDMEWAIAAERVWVLQSRPITALPANMVQPPTFQVNWESPREQRIAWEHYPYWRYVLKPLEIDYARDRADASRVSCCFTGGERSWFVKFVNGRVYSAWLPSDLPAGHRRIRRQMMSDLGERLHREGMTAWDFWGPEIETATKRLNAFNFQSATDTEVADHLEDARGVYHRHWSIHGSRLWITHQSHRVALKSTLNISDSALDDVVEKLLEGEANPTTRLIDGLYDLSVTARGFPKIASLIADPPENVLELLENLPEAGAFMKRYGEFISDFGARTGLGYGSDGTISTRTWREQPGLILRMASPYLDPEVVSPSTIRKQVQDKRETRLKDLVESCGGSLTNPDLRRELDYGRRQAAIMEIHNHYIDQMMNGQLRHAILGAAERLVGRGVLATTEDIFWLYYAEINMALRSHDHISFKKEISARKDQLAAWEILDPPPLIGTPDPHLPEKRTLSRSFQPDDVQDDTVVRGVGASSGRFRGRARIVPVSVLLPDIQPGEILVAKNVGPRWTPIFPILGGLVLDGGSVGQHHSIIAREYGIPAVVGTGNATDRIPEGALVTVDGDTGSVEID